MHQPAFRLDYQPRRVALDRRNMPARSQGASDQRDPRERHSRLQRLLRLDTVNRHASSVTVNYTLNADDVHRGTYGLQLQNELADLYVSPLSNRVNAGLGGSAAAVSRCRRGRSVATTQHKCSGVGARRSSPTAGCCCPPNFSWGNRIANAPPNLGVPGFIEHQPHRTTSRSA